jgi:hypothetical protein
MKNLPLTAKQVQELPKGLHSHPYPNRKARKRKFDRNPLGKQLDYIQSIRMSDGKIKSIFHYIQGK